MDNGVYVALSGAKLQELRLQIVANNLANASTTGYKTDKVSSRSFDFDLEYALSQQGDISSIRDADHVALLDDTILSYGGVYTETVEVSTDFSQGNHIYTGNQLDIALEGPGFIAVETDFGPRYTRQGIFHINSQGELVTSDGFRVRGNGLDDLGAGDVTIDTEGTVYIEGVQQGTIDIVEFDTPHVLRKEGHNLFVAKNQGQPEKKAKATVVKQSHLEQPNTNIISEMVNLIELNRMYETYQKTIASIDESTKKMISEIGSS